MKLLIIGGNRFVGLRLAQALAREPGIDLSVVNRTGQVAHAPGAAVYKADRANWRHSHVDRDWDVIVDFAAFHGEDARGAVAHFRKVKRYVFISTVSVYDSGAGLKETDFDPRLVDLRTPARQPVSYQEGKRRAEAVFTQEAQFETLSVRFPFILGPDDYTRRLEFHVERIANGQPFVLANPLARVSMIHADDAAAFLRWCLDKSFSGPLNVASPQPIALGDLVQRIETHVGRRALLMKKGAIESTSPYGVPVDWYVDTGALSEKKFTVRPISAWIDDLIDGAIGREDGSHRVH